jgi:hypothetical protein
LLKKRDEQTGGVGGSSGRGMTGSVSPNHLMAILMNFLPCAGSGGAIVCDAGCSSGRLLWAMMAWLGPANNRFIGFDLDSRVDKGVTVSTKMPSSWSDKEVTRLVRENRVELHVAMATAYDATVARVKSIDGVTHLMAVWEAWTPADQTYLWDLFCYTTTVKVFCMVMKKPLDNASYFNPVKEANREGFTCEKLPAQMECGKTWMYAYIVRKPADRPVTPRPESVTAWIPRKAGQEKEGRGHRRRV